MRRTATAERTETPGAKPRGSGSADRGGVLAARRRSRRCAPCADRGRRSARRRGGGANSWTQGLLNLTIFLDRWLDISHMTFDCRHAQPRQRRSTWLLALVLAGGLSALAPAAASAQERAQASSRRARRGTGRSVARRDRADRLARLFNFVLLAGALVYFLRTPVATYLASRGAQIRQDLVNAAEMRSAATGRTGGHRGEAERAAVGARGAEGARRRGRGRPSRPASRRRRRPNASGSSNRRGARSTCGCA